ncbi:MAG: hypothetical protein EOP93_19925, partial [Lysobacteraceae bacterium]
MISRLACCVMLAMLAGPFGPARAQDISPAASAAYLAANAKKPGTILRPSGVQYRVLRSGFGRRPGGNDVVRMNYRISLVDGRVVDGSAPGFPAAVAMSGISMAGLAEVLALMREGDRWQVAVPPSLALGAAGGGNGAIPPEQALLFDITLVSAAPPRP